MFRLECKICVSPSELYTIESINWFYNSTTNKTQTNIQVDGTEHTLISPVDASLNIYDMQLDQEGLYWCKFEATVSASYYVHVANDSEPIIQVKPDEATNFQHAIPPVFIQDLNIKIYSDWSTWSSCSTCDIVGIKKRIGYCTISLKKSQDFHQKRQSKINQFGNLLNLMIFFFLVEESEEPTTVESSSDEYADNPSPEREKLKNLAERFLLFFNNKIPCRSRYTPREIQEIPEIKDRKSEIMTRYCKIKCEKNLIFEVRDEKGNVLESANNSAGIYSMLQGMPETQPNIERVTLYRRHNEKTELKCPGYAHFF